MAMRDDGSLTEQSLDRHSLLILQSPSGWKRIDIIAVVTLPIMELFISTPGYDREEGRRYSAQQHFFSFTGLVGNVLILRFFLCLSLSRRYTFTEAGQGMKLLLLNPEGLLKRPLLAVFIFRDHHLSGNE